MNWLMSRPSSVKLILFLLAGGLLLSGCATSTVESRRHEKAAAYAALPADQRKMVDAGQIRVGMSADAVYIAWGKPSEVLQREDEQGAVTIWLYYSGWMQETRYWSYHQVGFGPHAYLTRYLEHDYYPMTYVSAEIIFEDGQVKRWRTLPRPPS